jgi:two-component system phosphate regulon sensor histidine kinase PhoR
VQSVYSLIFIILFGTISYFLVLFILNRYINEKIQPIYKTIREVPISGKKEKLLEKFSSTNISDVQKEVEEWAKNQTLEITRLKDLERYRKEFVGNVSHELKTPIFNIQGYVLTLLEGGIDDPKINKLYLQRTEKSIDRMISIVEDLESITKLESGELKLNFVNFDLVKLAEEVFELAQMLAHERNITLEFVTKKDKPVMIYADFVIVFLLHHIIQGDWLDSPTGVGLQSVTKRSPALGPVVNSAVRTIGPGSSHLNCVRLSPSQ